MVKVACYVLGAWLGINVALVAWLAWVTRDRRGVVAEAEHLLRRVES